MPDIIAWIENPPVSFNEAYPAPTNMPYDGNKFFGALSAILAQYPLNRAATDKVWAALYAVGAVDDERMKELATQVLDDYESGRLAHEGKEALQRWRELGAKDKDQAVPEDSSVPPRPSKEAMEAARVDRHRVELRTD